MAKLNSKIERPENKQIFFMKSNLNPLISFYGSRLKTAAVILCWIVMCGCLIYGQSDDKQSSGIVARKDYDIGKNWRPKQIMGKDFWSILDVNSYTHPDKGSYVVYGSRPMRELVDRPLFKESGLYYEVGKDVPDSNKMSILGLEPKKTLEFCDTRPDKPFFLTLERLPLFKLMKKWECDTEGYNAWKKAHPNFMGCVFSEFDNCFLSNTSAPWGRNEVRWEKMKKSYDKELIATIEREFPEPKNRKEATAQLMKICKAWRECFFNDFDKVNYMRASQCYDHYYYESGAGIGWMETTNTAGQIGTSNYRHQTSLFFTRGAARQYDKSWAWYIAADYNGYDDKGNFNFSSPNYLREKVKSKGGTGYCAGGLVGPDCGMSPSLCERDMFLAYLSGASFVSHEGWFQYLYGTRKDGNFEKLTLSSPFGKAWEGWFEFTRKNPDRGASYTPVALLVPFEQGYPNYGGKSWDTFDYERPDWMIDAFMFTIMPYSPVTKNGDEGALANSPYGDIYDVIVPNTPKAPVPLDVLNNYKVAVMLGKYPKNKALAERLMEYVKNGGTLLVNIKQVNDFFPAVFLGLDRKNIPENARDMYAVKVKGPVRSVSDRKTFALSESYEMEVVKLKGATPLLKDANGNILACENNFGKGHVLVSTVDYLIPKDGNDKNVYSLNKMVYGKKFPFVEYFLKSIVKEVLPLKVTGDIEYGMNKLSDGWLLYLINNKGVTKFTNKAQKLDMSKTAKVEVSLKDVNTSEITELREQKTIAKDDKNNSFSVDVPPGGIKVIKIKKLSTNGYE